MILIDAQNSGTANAMKTIKPYNGADVVFDFSGQGDADGSKRGIVLDGDYWHFYDFEITKAADNGMLLSGNNNKIERMVFNDNQDTGLQLSRYNTSAATIADWPSNNLILNCTSKNNCDNASMENADGFAAKLTCGEGNVFDGCMAYNNSDDGWDLFAKSATGPIGVVTIQNCIAFRNGFTEFGEGYGNCDGNGFKLGGSGIGSAHILKNCLAFENLHCGFTDNNNPKLGSLTNCTAVNNNGEGTGKPNFSCYRCTDPGAIFENMMSYYDDSVFMSDAKLKGGASNDKYVGTYENGVYYNSGYYQVDAKTAIKNGAKIGTKLSAAPAASDFITMAKAPEQGTDFDAVWRNADGSLNPGGLYETADSSSYKTMGYHMYNGSIVVPPTTTTSTSSEQQTTTTTTTAVQPTETTTGSETSAKTSETSAQPTETAVKTSETSAQPTETTAAPATSDTADTTEHSTATTPVSSGDSNTETTQTTASEVTSQSLYGDVNLDGKVDITDAVLLNKAVAGVVTLNASQQKNADCMADGELSTNDSTVLLQFLVRIVTSLPVTE